MIRLHQGCVVLALLAPVGAGAQTVPSYRSSTCDAFCDLFTGLTHPRTTAPVAESGAAPEGSASAGATTPTPPVRPRGIVPKTRDVVSVAAQAIDRPVLARVAAALSRQSVPMRTVVVANDSGVARARADLSIQPAPLVGEGQKAAVVAKLGAERLHMIAGRNIGTFDDLRGRSVTIALVGSAAQALAPDALRGAGLTLTVVPLDLDNALDALATGDADALVLVAPEPVARLAGLPADSGLHLLDLPAPADGVGPLRAAMLAAASYPALTSGHSVGTLETDALLIAKDAQRVAGFTKLFKTDFAEAALPVR